MAEYKSIYTGEEIDAGIGKANTALQSYTETDPIFSASPSASITNEDITNWNGKTNFSGSYNDLTDKPSIPSATSDLTNDSGFITNSVNNLVNYYLKNEVYTKDEVTALIGAIQQFHYEVVQELPQTGANNIMYLVPKSTSQTNNVYDEYVYSNGWEKIGDTEIDLSNYVTTTALNQALANYTTTANLTTLLAGKQDVIDSTHKLDASLVDDSLSANKFVTSAEKTTWNGKQDELTAGDNITINNNVISATVGKSNVLVVDGTNFTNKNWNGNASSQDMQIWNPVINEILERFTENGEKQFLILFKLVDRSGAGNLNNDDYNLSFITTSISATRIDLKATSYTYPIGSLPVLRYIFMSKSSTYWTVTYSSIPNVSFLTLLNRVTYNPTDPYNPATKKYVDDQVGAINTVLATLTTPTTNGGE